MSWMSLSFAIGSPRWPKWAGQNGMGPKRNAPPRAIVPRRGDLVRDRSDPAYENQDQHDHEHKAQTAARVVTPAAAVRPRGPRAEKQKNENDQKYRTKHRKN